MPRVTQPARTANPPATARRDMLRCCPRCNQRRTATQFPSDAPVCGACLPRWQRQNSAASSTGTLKAPAADAAPRQSERSNRAKTSRRGYSTVELIAELEWLLTWDTAAHIAARLGTTVAALERRVYRAHRLDLASKLRVSA